jgi:hypothetical protein
MDYDSTNWQIWSTNGSGLTNVVDTGVPITTDWLTVRVAWAAPGVIKYQINTNPWQQITTNVPTTGSDLHAYLMSYAASGYSTELDVDWVMVRQFAAVDPTIGLSAETHAG